MKLLLVTAVKSYQKQVVQLFKKAGILAFSSTDINGFKALDHEDLIDNWFSGSTQNVKSVLFFTFSDQENINLLLKELERLNSSIESDNPIRGIVLNIEKFQ